MKHLIFLLMTISVSSYAIDNKALQNAYKKQPTTNISPTKVDANPVSETYNRPFYNGKKCATNNETWNINDEKTNPYGYGLQSEKCLNSESYSTNYFKKKEREGKSFVKKYSKKTNSIADSYNKVRPDYNGVDNPPDVVKDDILKNSPE